MSNGLATQRPMMPVRGEPTRAAIALAFRTACGRTEGWTLRYPLVASFAWIGLLFAIAIPIYTPAFETNDDVVMSMFASGTGAATQPDEHLIFTSFAIGLMLKLLYTLCPAVPWYGGYLLGVHFLSHVAVLYSLLKWRYSRAAVFCYLVLFATVGIQLMARLQFTSTAVWATECGIFLALNGLTLRRDGEGHGGLGMLVAGMALMVAGSLIRFDSYIAAISLSAIPLLFLAAFWHRSLSPPMSLWRTALVVIFVTQCAAFGMHAAHQHYYSSDPAWREFLAFNPYRVKFNDYCWTSYTEETKPVFDRVNWSENDHTMIRMAFYDDPEIFGRKNLQAIVEGFPWANEAVSLEKMTLWWHEILRNVRLWPIWALIPLQLWLARDRRFAVRHFVILAVSLNVIICGLMLLKNPPARVYYPMVAFEALYTLYLMRLGELPSKQPSSRNPFPIGPGYHFRLTQTHWVISHGVIRGALVVVAILGLFTGQYKAYRDCRKAVKANRKLHTDLARIGPQESNLLVCWGCSFPYEAILPLESPKRLRNVHLLTIGWPQQSPINNSVKSRFGIQDLTLALMDDPNLYLLCNGLELAYYSTYIREHYGVEVDWATYFAGNDFNLFRPVKALGDRQASRHPDASMSQQ